MSVGLEPVPALEWGKWDTRYLFFTGKGGVGKTTTASAVAVALADAGKRTLVISTDPASNLDDVFGVDARPEPTAVPGIPGLFVSNLDPEAAAEATRRNNQTSPVPITQRTRAQVTRFFDGLDLMPPGVVPISEWDLGEAMDTTVANLVGYSGIARKP